LIGLASGKHTRVHDQNKEREGVSTDTPLRPMTIVWAGVALYWGGALVKLQALHLRRNLKANKMVGILGLHHLHITNTFMGTV